jgi:hypothetical protein
VQLWPGVVMRWGSTPAERAEAYPCDRLLPDAACELFRAVDVAAPAPVIFRWLCQLRAAPYSYDRIDNGGRPSPPTLTPGLERLEPGQRVMRIFRLVEFEPDRSITILSRGTLFGAVACTYRVTEPRAGRSRLLVKLRLLPGRGPLSLPLRLILPLGDLVMMRRQLLNLAALAQDGASAAPGA